MPRQFFCRNSDPDLDQFRNLCFRRSAIADDRFAGDLPLQHRRLRRQMTLEHDTGFGRVSHMEIGTPSLHQGWCWGVVCPKSAWLISAAG